MDLPILNTSQQWECPNCSVVDVTNEALPHSRFHSCAGLRGLTAPLVPAGTDCVVEAVERADYIGSSTVNTDTEGRPVMAVNTKYADGRNDVAVFPDCALIPMGN
jgi:hypothetical protein